MKVLSVSIRVGQNIATNTQYIKSFYFCVAKFFRNFFFTSFLHGLNNYTELKKIMTTIFTFFIPDTVIAFGIPSN